MKYRYTIIIPHFNSPHSLRVLLDSISKEEIIQVIVIDDNSTEDVDLLSLVIKEDNRSEFYINNTGVQSAGVCRNIGLQHAQGKWIVFADADDYFVEGFIEQLEKYYNDESDIIYFAPISIDFTTGKKSNRHILYAELIKRYVKHNNSKNTNNLKYRYIVPWSKMYRNEYIAQNKIEFESLMFANDIMFCTRAALYAKSIQATDNVIYCITKNKKTLTSTVSENNLDTRIDVMVRRYRLLREHLTKKEIKQLDISGTALIYTSLKWFGIKKMISTYRLLRIEGVKSYRFSMSNIYVGLLSFLMSQNNINDIFDR